MVVWLACTPAAPSPPPGDRLVTAVAQDSLSVVLRLLTEGVAANLESSTGELALHQAIRLGRDTMVAELLVSGADPSLRDGTGHSGYDLAMLDDRPAMLDRLLVQAMQSAGGGERVREWMQSIKGPRQGQAPKWHEVLDGELLSLGMMYVALHGTPNEIRQLRRAREIPNRTGYHALAVAARWGRSAMVSALLGIDVRPDLATTSPEGYTAITFARLGGHQQIIARLVAAGARSEI
jgi:ankyrin repeat protein